MCVLSSGTVKDLSYLELAHSDVAGAAYEAGRLVFAFIDIIPLICFELNTTLLVVWT